MGSKKSIEASFLEEDEEEEEEEEDKKFVAQIKKDFQHYDTDADGLLDSQERETFQNDVSLPEHFQWKPFDRNKDGKLDWNEFLAMGQMYAPRDLEGDDDSASLAEAEEDGSEDDEGENQNKDEDEHQDVNK